MARPDLPSPYAVALFAGFASGTLSAATLPAFIHMLRNMIGPLPELFEIWISFALTVGLSFAVIGGAYARRYLGLRWRGLAVWTLTSMLGIIVAFHASTPFYDTNDLTNFYQPFLIGSLVGGSIFLIPVLFVGQFTSRLWVFVKGVGFSTAWALFSAYFLQLIESDDPLQAPGSVVLFAGWQAAMLLAMAGSALRDARA
ncbi:MAG: hypothetical protein AAGF68_07580 [Pseudomonadota bacterium]